LIKRIDQWHDVQIRHLVTLEAVARIGSFRRAAEELGYSQAAVSQQIATLERLLGERLIERSRGRGAVGLTEAGNVALRHADGIIDRLTAVQADVAAAGEIRVLRVGTFQSVGARLLPDMIVRFLERKPEVSIELYEAPIDAELVTQLAAGGLDLSFVMLPVPDGPIEARELLADPFVVLARSDSPLAGKAPLHLAELARHPLICARSCRCGAAAEAFVRAQIGPIDVAFRSDDNETIRSLVAAGLGAALVPRLLVGPDAEQDDKFTVVEIAEPLPPRRIAIAWHRDREHGDVIAAFLAVAEDVIGLATPDRGRGTNGRGRRTSGDGHR
jgi:molybdate transport repressor ModE-like protein